MTNVVYLTFPNEQYWGEKKSWVLFIRKNPRYKQTKKQKLRSAKSKYSKTTWPSFEQEVQQAIRIEVNTTIKITEKESVKSGSKISGFSVIRKGSPSVEGFLWWLRWYRVHLQCRRPGFNPWVRKIPLEEGMATHSSILSWEIPWTEEPGGLQSMGLQESDTT